MTNKELNEKCEALTGGKKKKKQQKKQQPQKQTNKHCTVFEDQSLSASSLKFDSR